MLYNLVPRRVAAVPLAPPIRQNRQVISQPQEMTMPEMRTTVTQADVSEPIRTSWLVGMRNNWKLTFFVCVVLLGYIAFSWYNRSQWKTEIGDLKMATARFKEQLTNKVSNEYDSA